MAIAADVVEAATPYLGMKESPAGSNKTRIGEEYGWNGVAWCHEAVSVWALKAGLTKNKDFPWTASCPVGKAWFQAKKRWYHTPQVGDFVYYSTSGKNGSPYHVELVIAVSSKTFTTIGGNTSGDAGNVHGNGDGCYEKTLSRSLSRISGFGRPLYNGISTLGDDMPTYISVDKNADSRKELLVPGEWHQVYFNQNNSAGAKKEHGDGDFPSFLTGPAYYSGDIYLRVTGLPKGVEGQVRCLYTDAKTNAVLATCPVQEFEGSTGDTFVKCDATGYVPKNAKLRVELVQYGPEEISTDPNLPPVPVTPTVIGGQVRLMAWGN